MAVPRAGVVGLADLVGSAVRLFDPGDCFFCGAAVGSGRSWCRACGRRIPFVEEPCCPRCSLPLPGRETHLCQACLKTPPPFDMTVSILEYRDLAAAVAREVKYNGSVFLLREIAATPEAEARLEMVLAGGDLAVPVPLHRWRLLKRGYNQSMLIARCLVGGRMAIDPLALARVRSTSSQTGMSGAQRRKNLRKAFRADEKRVGGKTVILVDDVMTTGATTSECGRALLRAGAAGVRVLTLARTPILAH